MSNIDKQGVLDNLSKAWPLASRSAGSQWNTGLAIGDQGLRKAKLLQIAHLVIEDMINLHDSKGQQAAR